MPYIAYLPYIPNIPYFPDMPYQTDHTHHTYPTYHTTPTPHHRGRGGQYYTPTTPQGGERDTNTPPPHHRRGEGQYHTPTTPQGGRGKISYGGSIWNPSHGGRRGGGRAWCIYTAYTLLPPLKSTITALGKQHMTNTNNTLPPRPQQDLARPSLSAWG